MKNILIVFMMVLANGLVKLSIAQDNDSQPAGDSQRMYGIYDDALQVEEDNSTVETQFLIDDFEKPSKYNLVKGITNLYQMPPSRIMMSTVTDVRNDTETNVLKLKFRKASAGGPYDQGGWCGYYSLLKPSDKVGADYFSADNYTYITMWVRGETGEENFVVGLSDRRCEKSGDSVKSYEIVSYLPEKKITQNWQKAKIPLSDFLLDLGNLFSLSICFERDCFPQGDVEGIVYIDDIAFE